MKKLVVLLLSLTMLCSCIAPAMAEEANPYKDMEKITIKWSGGHDTTTIPDDDPVVMFIEEKFNVDIQPVLINRENAVAEMTTMALSDDLPDIMWFENINNFLTMVDQEMCLELSHEMLAEKLPNSYKWLMEMDEGCFNIVTVDGAIYGLPRPNANGRYSHGVFWRADWLKAIGYEDGQVPVTLEDFEKAFYAFKELDVANTCSLDGGSHVSYGISDRGFWPIMGAFGALPDRWVMGDDGKVVFGAVHPGMRDALELLAKWYQDGIVDKEFITGENQGGNWVISNTFMQGNLGYSAAGYFYTVCDQVLDPRFPNGDEEGKPVTVQQYGKSFREFCVDYGYDKIAIGGNPVGPDGKSGGDMWGTVTEEAVALNANLADDEAKLDRLLAIVDWLNSDEDAWLMIDEWDPQVEMYDYNEELGYLTKDGYKAHHDINNTDTHSNMFNTLQNPYFAEKANPVRYNAVKDDPIFTTPGYSKMLIPVKTESMIANTTLFDATWIYSELYTIINGTNPIEHYDQWVKDWYANGGQACTDEANAWYEANAK